MLSGFASCAFCAFLWTKNLPLMAHDVESKLQFVSHSHHAVKGRSRFDAEVVTIDRELTTRSHIVSG